MGKPLVISLTPTKNEAHNLPRFLACASLWADHIIVADQGSTDGSRELIKACPKAIFVDNPSPVFNEPERQKLLIDAARRIPGEKVLVTLDADEMVSSEVLTHPKWQELLGAAPGTIGLFYWANIWPGFEKVWIAGHKFPWAFVDDGSEHVGLAIHSPRIPLREGAPVVELLRDLPVLHYAFVDWQRVKARYRWYACWEIVNKMKMRPAKLYRRYHEMEEVSESQLIKFEDRWVQGYRGAGINMRTFTPVPPHSWNKEIAGWLDTLGPRRFAKLDIWEEDWDKRFEEYFGKAPERSLRDPRRWDERMVMRWLYRTQARRLGLGTRMIERMLSVLGW
jgi:glycosyltransferase involved in cell wall biosynthesis